MSGPEVPPSPWGTFDPSRCAGCGFPGGGVRTGELAVRVVDGTPVVLCDDCARLAPPGRGLVTVVASHDPRQRVWRYTLTYARPPGEVVVEASTVAAVGALDRWGVRPVAPILTAARRVAALAIARAARSTSSPAPPGEHDPRSSTPTDPDALGGSDD